MNQQIQSIRIEQLFTPENNASLSYFYASNKLISNPDLVYDFFNEFGDYSISQQEKTLQQLISLLQTVEINAYTLNNVCNKIDETSDNCSSTIIQLIIDLLYSYVNNYGLYTKLLNILDCLLRVSSLEQKIYDRAITKMCIDYYSASQNIIRQIDGKNLFTTIGIIKAYFNAKIHMQKQPMKMLVFNGGRGLQICQKKSKQNNWLFSHGMSIYFWIKLQNIKYGSEAPLPKLFTFYSPNNGGLQCYLIDNKVYYRALGSKYSQPQIGSNGLCLGEIQPKKWVFVGIEHEAPRRLGRSQITFYINQKKSTSHLSPPSISSKQKMKIIFFDHAYCKTSSIFILPRTAESEVAEALNKNKNSIDSYKNSNKCYIFQQNQGKLYERKGQLGYSMDSVLSRDSSMSFQNVIPLFSMLKYINKTQYPILNQLLELFVLYLHKSQQNQIIAQKNNYPHMIAELIKQIPNLAQVFTSNIIGVLLHIKQTITSSELLIQFYSDFLWSFIDTNISIFRKQELLEIIKKNFTQNISYFSNIIGLDQMINIIVKLQRKSIKCCEKHYKTITKRFNNSPNKRLNQQFDINMGQIQIALDFILKMIELYIQNQKVNSPSQIYKLCKLLSLKFSPCFTLSLMNLLKKILTQRSNQKINSGQNKKIFEYLTSKKVYLLFLHVIENSFFAQLKAESVKIIYTLLLKKADEQQQNQISHRISKALWKINQQSNLNEQKQQQKQDKPVHIIQQEQNSNKDQIQSVTVDKKYKEDQVYEQKPQMKSDKFVKQQYQQIGPQAPKLSNKLKANKKFNFNFMSDGGQPEKKQTEAKPEQKKKRRNSEQNYGVILTKPLIPLESIKAQQQLKKVQKPLVSKSKVKKKQSRFLFREDNINDSDGNDGQQQQLDQYLGQQIMQEQKTNNQQFFTHPVQNSDNLIQHMQDHYKFEQQEEQLQKLDLPQLPQKQRHAQIQKYKQTQQKYKQTQQKQKIKKTIKLKKPMALNINTDAINQMYTFGGQKGQQIVISQEQDQQQINKIRRLARKCLSKMKAIEYDDAALQNQILQQDYQQQDESPYLKRHMKPVLPPPTTTNKALKTKSNKIVKLESLKLIHQEEDDENIRESSGKKVGIRNRSQTSYNPKLVSPQKSPISMNKFSEENMIVLYKSLMECCVTTNFELQVPAIFCIFFNWIPQTNLETKFLMDLILILESDTNHEKIKVLSNMPELYDFILQLTYKGLLFQELQEEVIFMKKLQEIIQKIYSYIFQNDPDCTDKLMFLFDWAKAKGKVKVNEYHPKCLFFATRYIFQIIMGSVQEDLFTNGNDKLMERNFQILGKVLQNFCKFLPIEDPDIYLDQYQRVCFSENLAIIPSLEPFFTSVWADYIICEKYYLLFRKFVCTDWYTKTLKTFKTLKRVNSARQSFISSILSSQNLQLTAQAQFFLKNSFIFTLVQINRYIYIDKKLSEDLKLSASINQNQTTQLIWQTIFIVILAEFSKQKNQKNNSQFVMSFLKNCNIMKELQTPQAADIVPFILQIRQFHKNNHANMSISGLFSQQITLNNASFIREKATSITSGKLIMPFVESLIQNYINQKLFISQIHEPDSPEKQGPSAEKLTEFIADLQAFKLNFQEIVIPSSQPYNKQIKSDYYDKFERYNKKIEEISSDFIQDLSTIIEEETQRFKYTQILLQTANRKARSQFRKIWKNLRIFGSSWTHPDLKLQNDFLFSRSMFTHQRYQASQFYKWKIAKHVSKYRLRYLLKPILFENLQNSYKKTHQPVQSNQKQEIGLNKALAYYTNNQLLLGKRVLNWLIDKNFDNVQIIMSFKKVRLIKTLTMRHGYLAIMNQKLLFVANYHTQPESYLAIDQYKLRKDKCYYKMWPIEFIKQIFRRRYVNRKRALQITFIHGKSAMFQFYQNEQEQFLKKILKLKGTKCPNLIYNGHKSLDSKKIYESEGLYKKWNTYQISNFQYIMELNNLGGRSYCDLTQYPVMPWVLINFDTNFEMNDESNYRDLSLPLGALGSQSRTQHFRSKFEDMKAIQGQSYHYGTHYSSPGVVYHYLVRLSPFTEGSILLQNGKMDIGDRLFCSLGDSYRNAISQTSDVRQLLPQLYTIPQVYLNINKVDLGQTQNKKKIHNVQLPPWARQNPYLYITKLRKVFQKSFVCKSLNSWIDLIFGYKQRGQEAQKSLNCFYPITYEDSINFDQIQDKKTVIALQTQVVNFGQTPSQIFHKPHPQKSSILSLPTYGMICDKGVDPKIYRPSHHSGTADLLKDEKQFNSMQQSQKSIIHMKWFKDSRLVLIRKNGQMIWYKWHTSSTSSPTHPKVPFQCAIQKQKLITLITKKGLLQMDMQYDPSLKIQSYPIQFLNNGHHIALGGLSNGKLLVIDADTNTLLQLHHHYDTICCLRSDLKNNFLITGDVSGKVTIWRITSSNRLVIYNEMKDHKKKITSIFISYDLRFFFTSSQDGSVYGYNIITGKKMKVYYHPKRLPISNVIVSTSPLPIIIMFCNSQSIIYCFSINGQLIQRVHDKNIEHFLSAILIKDSHGFQHISYGNEHGETLFRNLPFLDNPTKHTVARDAFVNRICISKSGKFIVTGCSDGYLSVITAPDQPR